MKASKLGKEKAVRVLIADDESLARMRIKNLLSGREAEFSLVGECSNGKDTIEALETNIADLLFLDIQMRDMDGFEVLKKTKTKLLPVIIFVTAYDKYALDAFEVHAVDYLLKPFDDDRFNEMLERVYAQIKNNKINDLGRELTSLLADFAKNGHSSQSNPKQENPRLFDKRLVIKSTGKVSFVEVKDIEWVGAEGSYVSLNMNGKAELMRTTLKKLETKLNPEKFLRIHRSTIVNISSIKELKPHFHGEYVVFLKNGKRLKLSRNYRESAEKLLGGHF